MKNQKPLSLLKSILFFFIAVIFASCNQNASKDYVLNGGIVETEVMLSEPPPVEESLSVPSPPQDFTERKLIKEGDLAFETDDLLQTRKRIDSAIKNHRGYIASEMENKYNKRLEHTLVIRIPAEHFDLFISDAIIGVDRLDSKNIRIKDVTEEFLDIRARLKTKKELEQRYLDLLKKANKVTEMLEIEKQIGELRADIESIEGRLQYLNNQSSLSTITITYYKSVPTSIAYENKFVEGFSNGWNNLVWFIVGLINIWPFILLITGFVFLIRFWWRKRKARN